MSESGTVSHGAISLRALLLFAELRHDEDEVRRITIRADLGSSLGIEVE
jgi:hypothetical protein